MHDISDKLVALASSNVRLLLTHTILVEIGVGDFDEVKYGRSAMALAQQTGTILLSAAYHYWHFQQQRGRVIESQTYVFFVCVKNL